MSVSNRNTTFPAPLTVRLLDTNGDGTGTVNANGNYSVTPTLFYRQPGLTQSLSVSRITATISDAGGFEMAGYGSQAVAQFN